MAQGPLAEKELALYRAHNRLSTPCQFPADPMSISSVRSVAHGVRKLADAGGLDGSAEHQPDAGACIGFRASEGPELAEAPKSVSRSEFLSLGKPV